MNRTRVALALVTFVFVAAGIFEVLKATGHLLGLVLFSPEIVFSSETDGYSNHITPFAVGSLAMSALIGGRAATYVEGYPVKREGETTFHSFVVGAATLTALGALHQRVFNVPSTTELSSMGYVAEVVVYFAAMVAMPTRWSRE